MKVLAVDTATEHCSAAVVADRAQWMRNEMTARSHADLVLPMVEGVLNESGFRLEQMDGLAFGRGPGSFTGVRIGVSVIQGLGLASHLNVVGVSNLAAVAQRAALEHNLSEGSTVLVCMDARMREVYWATYRVSPNGLVALIGDERVSAPADVVVQSAILDFGAGTGWRSYTDLTARFAGLAIDGALLPRAIEIAHLALPEFIAGNAVPAAGAQPIYLRDRVVAEP